MPLSKKRNRDRMRIIRATQVQPKVVQPNETKQEKLKALRGLINIVKNKSNEGIPFGIDRSSIKEPPEDSWEDWEY